MALTLINPFIVPAEMGDDEFLRRWHDASDRLAEASGFLGAQFHRNTGDVDQTFRFINIASWESAEAYQGAFGGAPGNPADGLGVKFYPGLFTPVVVVRRA